MKILIIRLSSLGDILLTFPLISNIKDKYPQSNIDYLVKKEYTGLFQLIDGIDSIIQLDAKEGFSGLQSIKKKIRNDNYDIIIDLHNNQRSIFIRSFVKAQKFVFKKSSIKKFLLVKFKINLLKNIEPIIRRYRRTFFKNENSSFDKDDNKFVLKIPKEIENTLKKEFDFLNYPEKTVIGMCPSARHFTKIMPAEKFIMIGKSVLEKYNAFILLFGDESDFDRNESIKREIGEKCYNLSRKLTLVQTAAVMNGCNLIVTNDTGLMHLANLLKKNLIAVFGSTVREFGFFPQGNDNYVFEVEGLSCRPCSHIGRKECPKGHFKCMTDISVEKIIVKIDQILLENCETNSKKGSEIIR